MRCNRFSYLSRKTLQSLIFGCEPQILRGDRDPSVKACCLRRDSGMLRCQHHPTIGHLYPLVNHVFCAISA
jgi:hypothetical protein